jgi:hypothetical protein
MATVFKTKQSGIRQIFADVCCFKYRSTGSWESTLHKVMFPELSATPRLVSAAPHLIFLQRGPVRVSLLVAKHFAPRPDPATLLS